MIFELLCDYKLINFGGLFQNCNYLHQYSGINE